MLTKKYESASMVLETMPILMRMIGGEMDKQDQGPLSVQQMRVMMFIHHHQAEGLSLSTLCQFMHSTLSATSKLVDGLIRGGYLNATPSSTDRRIKLLATTPAGEEVLQRVHHHAVTFLSEKLNGLTDHECEIVSLAMDVLRLACQPKVNNQSFHLTTPAGLHPA